MAIYNIDIGVIYLNICRGRRFTKCMFLSHNFGSSYARKPIKSSKDSDNILDSEKQTAKKLAHWIGACFRVKLAKKRKNTPLVTSPTENPKRKFFFQSQLQDLPNQ